MPLPGRKRLKNRLMIAVICIKTANRDIDDYKVTGMEIEIQI